MNEISDLPDYRVGDRLLLSLRDRQLVTLFETTLDAIAIADNQGHYLDVNPAACELFGLEREQLLGRSICEFAETKLDFQQVWQKLPHQEKVRGEFRLVRVDGDIRIVEYAATANFLPDCHLLVMRDITAYKRAETQVRELTQQLDKQVRVPGNELAQTQAQLQESQQRLESILNSIEGVVWSIDPETSETIYINPAVEQIFGCSVAEFFANPNLWFEIIHPDDRSTITTAFITLREQGKASSEYRIIRRDGQIRWLAVKSYLVYDQTGNPIRIDGITTDISDRKQAEIENWQTQNFLNSIIENIPNMIFVKDANTLEFLRFNKAGEELLGYPKEALLGKCDHDFFPPEQAEFFIAKDREVLAQGKIVDIPEEQVTTTHQGTRILHTKKIPILNELGHPQYLLGISEDITERKQAEAKLIEITQLQQAILDGANYAIISTDTNGIIKTINAVAQKFLGYSSAEIVDKVTPAIFHDLEEIKQRATELTTELGQPITPGFEVFVAKARLGMIDEHEWSYIRQDGSRFPVQLSITALRDQEGTITGFLGIASDISEQQAALRERQEAEAQLQEISARLSMALKSGRIGCWEWDIVQNKLIWDDRIYEIYDINKNSETPLTYDIWKASLHPDDRVPLETLVHQTLLGQAELDTEFRSVHSDGSIHFIKAFGIVQRDIEGNPQKLIGVNFDISEQHAALRERKEAENKLRQNEQKYHQILDAITDMVLVKGPKSRIVWANKAFRDYYGMTNEQLEDMIDAPFNEPDYTLQYIRDDAYVFETGQSLEIEEPVTRYDGKVQIFNTIKSVIRNEVGEKILTVGVSRDITEQQAVLRDRQRQEQALRLIVEGTAAKTGEEFFKSCVQYLAQVLEVRYALISEFVDSEKLRAKTLSFWAGEGFGNNFTYNLAGTPCKNIDIKAEIYRYPTSVQRLFPEDDDLVTLQAESYAGLPIVDAEGNHLGLLAVLDVKPMGQDIEMQSAILKIFATRAGAEMERMQAEAALRASEIQLRQQTEELEAILKKLQNTQTQLIQAEKMSSLGQLVAGVAHEINNPVSFIYSNIQPATNYARDLIELIRLYQEHYPSPPQMIADLTKNIDFEYLAMDFSKLLASMETGATRIKDIVKSLRTFSRLDEASFKAINIHENIDSTLVILQNRLNGRAGEPKINVIKNYGNLPLVECYGGLLNQVFMNLFVNGIDAIEQQRERLELTGKVDYIGEIIITTAITSENQVSISIQDNGCGMSPEVQAQIFNPFFTTKPIGKGTGMGLATSYQIIEEQHQGSISVNSTLGEGTEFAIALSIKAPI